MTSPPCEIEVQCPSCGQMYRDWYRPSINLSLDDFSEEDVEKMMSVTCPHCGHIVRMDGLVVRADGVFEFHQGQEPQGEDQG